MYFQANIFLLLFCTLKLLQMKQTQGKLCMRFSHNFEVLLLNFTDLFEN